MLDRCLQLDVGNSSAKWRMLEAGVVTAQGKYLPGDGLSLKALTENAKDPQQIWISSVAGAQAEATLTQTLKNQWCIQPWFARTAAQTNGLINSYADPGRMGVDRWLAMLGARQKIFGRLCVVDAGSALTIDIISANGQHEGGYILPGPALMERALLLDTDRVRFEEDASYKLSPGVSTAEAVRHGIAIAQTGAVRLVLTQLDITADQLVICGGGGEILASLLGEGVYAPDLVFEGLTLMAESERLR